MTNKYRGSDSAESIDKLLAYFLTGGQVFISRLYIDIITKIRVDCYIVQQISSHLGRVVHRHLQDGDAHVLSCLVLMHADRHRGDTHIHIHVYPSLIIIGYA